MYASAELEQYFYISENEEKEKINKHLDKIIDNNNSIEKALTTSPWCIDYRELEKGHLQQWENVDQIIKDLKQIQASFIV